MIPFPHEEMNHDHVKDEKSTSNYNQPKGVTDVGFALGVPASVGHILSLENVVLKFDVKLDNPGDQGNKACKGCQ